MNEFWTCGPFKEAQDRVKSMRFKSEQMKLLLDVLEESKVNNDFLENGTDNEKLLASIAQLEIDRKIATLLGVPENGTEKENDEVLREVLLEYIGKRPEK
tara:strand:+ start:154 stop:453 length:300 start_codon:yes stop_codon:yes gene_type:complete